MASFLYYLTISIIWLIIIAGIGGILYFIFKTLKNKKKTAWALDKKSVLLQIDVPKDNEKTPLAAEQMFASIHGIYRDPEELKTSGAEQEDLAFEMTSKSKSIRFYAYVPEQLKSYIEGQIYAQYPKVRISTVEDYVPENIENKAFASAEITLNKDDYFPIKTFPNFEVDPLASITSALTETGEDEELWIQIIVKPVSDDWADEGISYVDAVRSGKASRDSISKMLAGGAIDFGKDLFKTILNPEYQKEIAEASDEKPEIPATVEEALKAVETKATKLGYETSIRIFAWAESPETAKTKLQNLSGVFKQFNTTNQNGFIVKNLKTGDENEFQKYRARLIDNNPYVLNIEELASIFHLPSVSVETPNIVWAGSKIGEPPTNLPIVGSIDESELTAFAQTDFRDSIHKFGLKIDDRRRHIYTIGKTGTGKSTMLENMAVDDIREGRGLAFIDPHGDPVERVMRFIPPERINDVVIFDPSDSEYPIGFNLLENVNPEMKTLVVSGLIGIFQKIWGFSWGPRLEYILRNAIMALMDYPNSTLIDILRMISDNQFQRKVIEHVKDPVVKEFWTKEFAGYNDRLRTEAISPIQNKVGQFVSSPVIRNIIGQPKSTINLDDIINNNKILLVNLSKGKIGEDNSALLGAMLVTKIQLAAMNRAYIPEEQRKDFFLYVDEFQNFATESFATIFSEARKYRLSLIVANQYIAQMPEEVRDAVFGNVGTIISFRVGAQDAPFLAKEMAPVFEETDLVNLDKFHIYTKMAIDGVTSPAFSAVTLPPSEEILSNPADLYQLSRSKYSMSRAEVEEIIQESIEPKTQTQSIQNINKERPNPSFTRTNNVVTEKPIEEKKKKGKGPSAVIKLDENTRFFEYIDEEGKRWYEPEKNEEEKNKEKGIDENKRSGENTPNSFNNNQIIQNAEDKKPQPNTQNAQNIGPDALKTPNNLLKPTDNAKSTINPQTISQQSQPQFQAENQVLNQKNIHQVENNQQISATLPQNTPENTLNTQPTQTSTNQTISTFYRPEPNKTETQYASVEQKPDPQNQLLSQDQQHSNSSNQDFHIIEPNKTIKIDPDK